MTAVYWSFAVMLLSVGGTLLSVVAFLGNLIAFDSMYFAFLPMLIGDSITIINFLPRDLYHLIVGELDGSGWCQFSAFLAIANCVSLNVNATAIAFFTRRLVANTMQVEKKMILQIWIAGWICGFVLAAVYTGTSRLGKFRGIYCCFEKVGGVDVVPYFVVCGSSAALMILFYYQAVQAVKRSHDKVSSVLNNASNAHVRGLMNLGIYMVSSFYACWTLVCVLAIFESAGVVYGVGWDMVAAWLLKLQPILDSVIILKGFRKFLESKHSHGSHGEVERQKGRKSTATREHGDIGASPVTLQRILDLSGSPMKPLRTLHSHRPTRTTDDRPSGKGRDDSGYSKDSNAPPELPG